MIKKQKITHHCGHDETRLFIGRKKHFDFWVDHCKYDECLNCDPERANIDTDFILTFLVLVCAVLVFLYLEVLK